MQFPKGTEDELSYLGKLFGGVGNITAQVVRKGLNQITLGDPTDYILQLVASAVAGGASYIEVWNEAQDFLIEFDGVPVGSKQLQNLYSNLQSTSLQLRKLALGLNSAFATEIDQVVVESWDGTSGCRLTLKAGDQKVDPLRAAPSPNPRTTMRLRFQERSKLRTVTKLVTRFSGTGLLPEGEALRNRCAHAGPVISVSKLKINQPVDLGPCLVWRYLCPETPIPSLELRVTKPRRGLVSERVSSGPFYAVLALGRPGPFKGFTCIAGGATLPAEETLRFSGASIVASAGSLESDLKHSRISPNSTYVNLLGILEQEMVLMALQLLDSLDTLSSEDKVEAAPILDDLATYLLEKHEHRHLEKVLRAVVEIRERCLPPGHQDLMNSRFRLADYLSEHDRQDEALPIYERLVPSIQSIAHNHLSKHRIDEAVNEFQRALELKMVISDPTSPALAKEFHDLGEICKENRHPAAEDLYRRALQIRELRVKDEPQPVIDTLYGLADTYRSRKLLAEAENLSRRALQMTEEIHGPNHPSLVPHLKLLAEILKGLGRYGECTDLDSRAMLLKYRRG